MMCLLETIDSGGLQLSECSAYDYLIESIYDGSRLFILWKHTTKQKQNDKSSAVCGSQTILVGDGHGERK